MVPYHAGLADGPADGAAHWLTSVDGLRLRVVGWNRDAGAGTILLFPGRTEYAEKYGRAAADMAARGYATIAIDWRGQGLAQRMLDARAIGHVADFLDYQHDVAAMVDFARSGGWPEPYYLLAHSMGGCIGLRSLMDGLPVAAAAFTAPMWGIQMTAQMRPVAWALTGIARRIGLSGRMAPGQEAQTYVLRQGFEGNSLTRDPDMWGWMRAHQEAEPELALGGPSLHWLGEALSEMRALSRMPSPDVACGVWLGGAEKIVDPARVRARMGRWPGGVLHEVPNAEHEIMMELPPVRAALWDGLAALFRPR